MLIRSRRRYALQIFLLTALTALFGTVAGAGEKPNVLLILVDDLKPAMGCYGDPVAKTPNMDALAARGMRFDLAYCNQAVCAPSRFTLMLGSHSTSTGLYGLGSQLRELVPDAVTMPQHFARHGGYRTESLGKVFHIGHGNHGDPGSFTVPPFYDKVIEYLDPASTDGGKLTREEALFTNQHLGSIRSLPRGAAFESPLARDEDYADGRVAAEAIRRLEAARQRYAEEGTPFFIAVGFVRPHLPFSVPKRYWDLYQPSELPVPEYEQAPTGAPDYAVKRGGEITAYKPVPEDGHVTDPLRRRLIHGYYASVSYVDAQIGKVMAAVDRLGLADNTIIVLWGDHGFHLGDHGIWTKHTNYEQANRIPLLIVAPGVTRPGSVTQQLAETVDLFPTLAELAGLPAPDGPQPIDGVSLVPVLKNPQEPVRDHAYHAYPRKRLGRAIRTQRYRLVEWRNPGEPPESAEYELYDYQEDPLETRNLASARPDVVERLAAILARYPEPVPLAKSKRTERKSTFKSPNIANKPLTVTAEVRAAEPAGVVIAQGGHQHGFALHFVDGKPAFDVRLAGTAYRVMAPQRCRGSICLKAVLNKETMTLFVDDQPVASAPSPGLIPVQPQDELAVGLDTETAAGDYVTPNPFNGTIISARVDVDGQRPTMPKAMSRAELERGLESHDRALLIKEGWIRDPYIVLGPDDYYYLTGTTARTDLAPSEVDPYNTGLGKSSIVGWKMRVWRSRNLIDWEDLGTPFTLKDGIWYQVSPERFASTPRHQWRLWAPELHWLGNRWAVVHTSPSPVRGANLALTQGPELRRPWVNPMGTQIQRRHDPSLFRDDDGTWWLIWGATSIAPLQPDFSGFAAPPTNIGPAGEFARMGHEGCLIRKIDDQYVLFGTGWSTGKMRRGSYNLYYAVSDKITGPYGKRQFVGRFLGHGTPLQDRQGRWWCTAFYNANVPPLSRDGIRTRDLSETAQTINQQGTTLVPLEVRREPDGNLYIRAKDPDYATPGPDEAQQF